VLYLVEQENIMDILLIAAAIIIYGLYKHYHAKYGNAPQPKTKRSYGFSDRINQINWMR